jgi:hypothetical protein
MRVSIIKLFLLFHSIVGTYTLSIGQYADCATAEANPILIADPSVNSCDQFISTTINLGTGPLPVDGFPGGSCGTTNNAQHNYWVSFIMPANSAPSFAVDIDIVGSCTSSDLKGIGITSYVGSCGTLTKVIRTCSMCNSSACNEKFFTSSTKFTAGTKIFLQIFDTSNTNCDIRLKLYVSPANDYCSSAFDLQPNKSFCNRGGTTTSEVITSPGGCSPSPNKNGIYAINNPIWFKFSVTDSDPQPYKISIDNISCVKGGQAMQMIVYDASCPCSAMNTPGCYVACTAQEEPAVTTTLTIYPGAANPGQVLPNGNYYLVIDGANGSDCQWKFNNAVLPVKLSEISTTKNNDGSLTIDWSVQDEKNIQYYNIQRSMDGIHYTTIETIVPINNNYTGPYHYIDQFTLANELYYRIEIVESDESINYSKSVYVPTSKAKINISTYTLPLGYFTVYTTNDSTNLYLMIYDTSGKNIWENYINVENKKTMINIDIQHWLSGIYFIKAISSEGEIVVKKIII